MTAIVAPASVAVKPMPFLLEDLLDSLNQLAVVEDERWDELLRMAREKWLLPGREPTIIDTPKGPFLLILDEDVRPDARDSWPQGDDR